MKEFKETPNTTPEYPSGLSPKDIELINAQCVLQSATSKEQIEGFANAYAKAKNLATEQIENLKSFSGEEIENLILELAEMTERRNKKGYRKVAVRFANGSKALDPELIERAMQGFCGAYAENILEPVEAYTEFEKIHPFEDGNGRVGDLLWKIAITRNDGDWPETLPPDVFGSPSK